MAYTDNIEIGEEGKVVIDDNVLEVMELEENINGDGGLTLGWNSPTGGGISAGLVIDGYVLMAPYTPQANDDGSYRYDVKLSDPIAPVLKKLFYKVSKDSDNNDVTLYTFTFVGYTSTIINALQGAAGVGCITHFGTKVISVTFDGDTIKSAAQKIADACGEPLWFANGSIHFGSPDGVSFQSGEYYTRFVVLGGTKNMSKHITTSQGDEYAAVTQRLTLDPEEQVVLPGSILSNGGSPEITKMLIFDNIYPKVRMKITGARMRRRWCLNEEGDKIATTQDDATAYEDTDGQYYKTYGQWYVTIGNVDGEAAINQEGIEQRLIDGTTLRMQFLPFTEGGNSVLAGREFELVHFTSETFEWDKDDVLDEEHRFLAAIGEYRIVMTADGGTTIPSVATLVPSVGDLVTLVNVTVPDTCYAKARQDLLAAGLEAMKSFSGQPVSYTERATGRKVGDVFNGYIVTNIHTDLITGDTKVTFGTFSSQGLLSSIVDKVDGVQLNGGGGTNGEESQSSQKVYTMSADQWQALANAGGNRGMMTVNRRIDSIGLNVESFGSDINAIKQQADQSMNILFGNGVPHPNSADDNSVNAPASAWVAESEKRLHLEDIYYNTNREASDEYGGRAWRWSVHNVSGTDKFWFDEVTDADTIAALEKIADVAYDGKLSGGSEKMRVFVDWQKVVEEYGKYASLNTNFGLDITEYNKYKDITRFLAAILDGETDGQLNTSRYTSLLNGTLTPAWLTNLNATTDILYSADFIGLLNHELSWNLSTANLESASREAYRRAWVEYYKQADILDKASKTTAHEAYQNVNDIADDGVISAGSEKSQLLMLWRQTFSEFWEYITQAENYALHTKTDSNGVRTPYHEYVYCYLSIGLMLENLPIAANLSNFPAKFGSDGKLIRSGRVSYSGELPVWIKPASDGGTFETDTRLGDSSTLSVNNASDYRNVWNSYYAARSSLLGAIEAEVASKTQEALNNAASAMSAVDQITHDGELTVDEIPILRREFESAYRERMQMVALTTDSSHKLIDVTLRTHLITYLADFKALAYYLNRGSAWTEPTTYSVSDDSVPDSEATYNVAAQTPLSSLPALLTGSTAEVFVDDWNAATPQPDGGAALRNLWATLCADQINITNNLTKNIKHDADQANSKVNALADDGIISGGSEKSDLLVEWRHAITEFYNRPRQLATSYGLTTVSEYTNLGNSFNAVATMLNNMVTATDGILNGTILPSWLQNLGTDTVLSSITYTDNGSTVMLTKAEYRNRWNRFYSDSAALTQVITAKAKDLADSAKNDAAKALGQLAAYADDKVITKAEKNELIKQWEAWRSEYSTLHDAAENPTISASNEWTAYKNAFYRLANFLKDLTDSTTEITVSSTIGWMLYNGENTNLATTERAGKYKDIVVGFMSARTALLSAFSTGKLTMWISDVLPDNDFYIGDRCVWLNHNADGTSSNEHTVMVCVRDWDSDYNRTTNWKPYWQEAKPILDSVHLLLANLAEILYKLYKDEDGAFPIHITLSTSPTAHPDNDPYEACNDTLVASFLTRLYERLGVFTLRIYTELPEYGYTEEEYDVLCQSVKCVVPGSEEDIVGGLQIRTWHNSRWEYIQESTSGLLDNFGKKILAMVFGSNAAATEAAGMTAEQRFAKMFATAQVVDSEGNVTTLSQALFGLDITPFYENKEDSTDIITEEQYNALTDAQKEAYTLKYRSDAMLSADKINFKTGTFCIRNENNKVTFEVDDNGEVRVHGSWNSNNGLIQTYDRNDSRVYEVCKTNNGIEFKYDNSLIGEFDNNGHFTEEDGVDTTVKIIDPYAPYIEKPTTNVCTFLSVGREAGLTFSTGVDGRNDPHIAIVAYEKYENSIYYDYSYIRVGYSRMTSVGFEANGYSGMSGSFETADGKTVTVVGGIIVDIS